MRRRLVPGLLPGLLLLAVPVLVTLLGPLLASSSSSSSSSRGVAFGSAGTFGGDFVGRDVLGQVLRGGGSVVGVAVLATVLTYLVALPLALLAATTHRRAVDEVVMRPLDVVVAMPSMLLLLLLVPILPGSAVVVAAVVAVINLPDVVRIVRATALETAAGTAVEALRMQGEGRLRVGAYVLHSVRRVALTDLGTRFTGALYLVASAAFLGVGLAADDANWAVMVDANRDGLFVNPAATVVPALLIITLSVGANLTSDRLLGGRR